MYSSAFEQAVQVSTWIKISVVRQHMLNCRQVGKYNASSAAYDQYDDVYEDAQFSYERPTMAIIKNL